MKNKEFIITYVTPIPLMKRIFGVALMFLGMTFAFMDNMLVGLLIVIYGCFFHKSQGFQINKKLKKYRLVFLILDTHFGSWKPYDNFAYISVFKTRKGGGFDPTEVLQSTSVEFIDVNLFKENNQNETFYTTDDKEEAFEVAQHLKKVFEIDILDATERERKWI